MGIAYVEKTNGGGPCPPLRVRVRVFCSHPPGSTRPVTGHDICNPTEPSPRDLGATLRLRLERPGTQAPAATPADSGVFGAHGTREQLEHCGRGGG